MSAYSNQVKDYVARYKAATASESTLDLHEVAAWALHNGLHKPNAKTLIDAIAADIAQVFREEYRTDKQGRRYRAKHAATEKRGGKTLSLWADLDDPAAPHSHFVRSFGQRRQQIVGDCLQLKTDVDVYNDKRTPAEPIQIPLDFTLDIEELQQPNQKAA
ncbi:hypothetical protein GGR63_002567 [Xanthomonas sp. 3272]|uniref:hypothetical protein n=1 Tax=Xanthomonas arboricola TaxID=56448 RepID=UPI00142F656C|nr:hypothetical protein [Xanthomonas arboricola]NJC02620.1 hypothetical protein [Xanthomonas arboricola]